MSVIVTTPINGRPDELDEPPLPAQTAKLNRFPVTASAPEQRILAVWFRSPEGRHWQAIGGGATVAAAITFARESCPDDATWDLVGWEDLYGD